MSFQVWLLWMIQCISLHCPEAVGCLTTVGTGEVFQIWRHFSTVFKTFFPLCLKTRRNGNKKKSQPTTNSTSASVQKSRNQVMPLIVSWMVWVAWLLTCWMPIQKQLECCWSACPRGLHSAFMGWFVCRLFGPLVFWRDDSYYLQMYALLLFRCTPHSLVHKEEAQQPLTLVYRHHVAFQT